MSHEDLRVVLLRHEAVSGILSDCCVKNLLHTLHAASRHPVESFIPSTLHMPTRVSETNSNNFTLRCRNIESHLCTGLRFRHAFARKRGACTQGASVNSVFPGLSSQSKRCQQPTSYLTGRVCRGSAAPTSFMEVDSSIHWLVRCRICATTSCDLSVGGADSQICKFHVPGPPKAPKQWTLYCLYSLFFCFWAIVLGTLEVRVGQ